MQSVLLSLVVWRI